MPVFFNIPRSRGSEKDTALHKIIRQCNSVENVQHFVETIGLKAATRMARTTNDCGRIPIEYIKTNLHLSRNKQIQLAHFLAPLSCSNSLEEISTSINFDLIYQKYNPVPDSSLFWNLSLACDAVNQVRKLVTSSTTHPGMNSKSKEERAFLRKKLDHMRDEIHAGTRRKDHRHNFSLIVEILKKYKLANCNEMARGAIYFAKCKNTTVPIDLFKILNGDHVFLVIGRDPASDPYNFLSWGSAAVVCDPWAGKVYPAHLIPRKLTHFYRFRLVDKNREKINAYNSIPYVNLKFHRLCPLILSREIEDVDFECVNDEARQNRKNTFFALFSRKRVAQSTPMGGLSSFVQS